MFHLGSRQTNLHEGDLLARLQDLQQRVDACERAVENETKDGIAELHSQVREIQDRVAKLDLEMHTQVSQIKKDLSKMIPQACSSSTLSNESSSVQLEAALELVRQEVAETRQNVDIKLQSPSEAVDSFLKSLQGERAELSSQVFQLSAQVADLQRQAITPVEEAKDPMHSALLQRVSVLEKAVGELTSRAEEDPQSARFKGEEVRAASLAVAEAEDRPHQADSALSEIDLHQEYQWEDSVYDIQIFLFLPGLGCFGSLSLVFMCLLNLLMVCTTIYVLSTASFTSPPLSDIDQIWAWRQSDGQDYSNVDPTTLLTLVSRVCTEDPTLSIGSSQKSLLHEINDYQEDGGLLLANVAVTLWMHCCWLEMRKAADFITAIASIPRAKQTILSATDDDGIQVTGFSHGRALLGFSIGLLRVSAAVLLLALGSLWLAYTTSITDLLLNASALGFVLDIDNAIFQASAPSHIISLMAALKPAILPKWKGRALIPLSIIFGTVGVLIYVNFEFVSYVDSQMQLVKDAMCEPEWSRQIVIGTSPLNWRTYAVEQQGGAEEHIKLVSEMIVKTSSGFKQYAAEMTSYQQVRASSQAILGTYAEWFPCEDESIYSPGGKDLNLGKRLWAATGNSTVLSFSKCSDAGPYCFELGTLGNNVRILCPVTCGCAVGQVGLPYMTLSWDLALSEHGCPQQGCLASKTKFLGNWVCKDGNLTFLNEQGWDVTLRRMREVSVFKANEFDLLTEKGCAGVEQLTPARKKHVCGTVKFTQNFHGLAVACPVACRCPENDCVGSCPTTCCRTEGGKNWTNEKK